MLQAWRLAHFSSKNGLQHGIFHKACSAWCLPAQIKPVTIRRNAAERLGCAAVVPHHLTPSRGKIMGVVPLLRFRKDSTVSWPTLLRR
jgi:hypothetical protein